MGNKLEQEVKFYLRDLKALEDRLIALGATLKQTRTREVNLRFDTPGRALSSSFQVLRLRKDQRVRLTYKGASDPAREVSAREELEVEVSDLETARSILEALGYEVMVIYEKYRAVYILDGAEVSLDETPLGDFCEIEGLDTENIRRCASRLGLNWETKSILSYLALFGVAKEKLNMNISNLNFGSFQNVKVTRGILGLQFADE